MSKLIVVVGVTGSQGGSVARTFLQLPEWRVRGITRNPSSETAKALAAEGVQVVQGDADDKESLVRAFQGATAIFSNVDFFTHLFYALDPANLPAGKSALQYSYDREVEQGLNIALAAEDPSVLRTLDRFVMSSLSNASKWSKGKYTTVYHFDSKTEILHLTEEKCPGVFSKLSTIQVGHYATNWRSLKKLAPVKQPDGTFLLRRNTAPDFAMPHVVAHRDTGAFVKAALDLPIGKTLLAVSEYMTFPKWAETFGRVHGVECRYEQGTLEELFEGVPKDLADEVAVSFEYIEDFGFDGGDPDVIAPHQLPFKVPTTSMEEFIRSEDWSTIFNA